VSNIDLGISGLLAVFRSRYCLIQPKPQHAKTWPDLWAMGADIGSLNSTCC
jgi:hypothetical protein